MRGTAVSGRRAGPGAAAPQGLRDAPGKPKAARAVGGACHCNPIAIIQPCHRVVGANGSLTGYAYGLEVKEYLLELEQD